MECKGLEQSWNTAIQELNDTFLEKFGTCRSQPPQKQKRSTRERTNAQKRFVYANKSKTETIVPQIADKEITNHESPTRSSNQKQKLKVKYMAQPSSFAAHHVLARLRNKKQQQESSQAYALRTPQENRLDRTNLIKPQPMNIKHNLTLLKRKPASLLNVMQDRKPF